MAPAPLPLPQALELLRTTLEQSPADFTEVAWNESLCQTATHGEVATPPEAPLLRCTLQIRVLEHGRRGSYTTGTLDPAELANGIRHALARAAVSGDVSSGGHSLEPPDDTGGPDLPREALFDERLARLAPGEATEILQQRLHSAEETGTLDWTIGRVAVLNSEGLERSATTTCARLRIACGTGLRQGRALSAARTLQQLDAPGTLERARLRRAEGEADLDPTGISAVCLAPEATAQLLLHLRRLARGAIAFPEGEPGGYPDFPSLAFDPQLHLEDNPLDPEALPFPFDLRGAPLAARDLLTDGKATASFPPPWRLGDERGSHLLLHAGALTDGALLERCDGGLYVSEIERVTCDDPRPLTLRCTFGGGRRIRAGRCTEAVPPETLTLPLLPALEKILGLGGTAVTVAQADGLLGGARAPGLALSLSPPR